MQIFAPTFQVIFRIQKTKIDGKSRRVRQRQERRLNWFWVLFSYFKANPFSSILCLTKLLVNVARVA